MGAPAGAPASAPPAARAASSAGSRFFVGRLSGSKGTVWLQEGLIEKVQAITDKPVEHFESSAGRATRDTAPAAASGGGAS